MCGVEGLPLSTILKMLLVAYLFVTWIPAVDYGIKIINPGAHAAHNFSVGWILAIQRNTDVLVLPTSLTVTYTFALTYKITVNITFFRVQRNKIASARDVQ